MYNMYNMYLFIYVYICKCIYDAHDQLIIYITQVLQKVIISGGGRCNVTHDADVTGLLAGYPRGAHYLRPALDIFNAQSTRAWFAERGVRTVVEEDGRVFPESNKSISVALCLEQAASAAGVEVRRNSKARIWRL